MIAPLPLNEAARLEALYRYGILDTPPEHIFDALAAEVAAALDAPIAIIGFIDQTRHWFKDVSPPDTDPPKSTAPHDPASHH